jgi:hypothetical protein
VATCSWARAAAGRVSLGGREAVDETGLESDRRRGGTGMPMVVGAPAVGMNVPRAADMTCVEGPKRCESN